MLAEAQIIPALSPTQRPAEPIAVRQYEPVRTRDEPA
jgi:hypothetical protein